MTKSNDETFGATRHMFKLSEFGLKPEEINHRALREFLMDNIERIRILDEAQVRLDLSGYKAAGCVWGLGGSILAAVFAASGLWFGVAAVLAGWIVLAGLHFKNVYQIIAAKRRAEAFFREGFIKAAKTPKDDDDEQEAQEGHHHFH